MILNLKLRNGEIYALRKRQNLGSYNIRFTMISWDMKKELNSMKRFKLKNSMVINQSIKIQEK